MLPPRSSGPEDMVRLESRGWGDESGEQCSGDSVLNCEDRCYRGRFAGAARRWTVVGTRKNVLLFTTWYRDFFLTWNFESTPKLPAFRPSVPAQPQKIKLECRHRLLISLIALAHNELEHFYQLRPR